MRKYGILEKIDLEKKRRLKKNMKNWLDDEFDKDHKELIENKGKIPEINEGQKIKRKRWLKGKDK